VVRSIAVPRAAFSCRMVLTTGSPSDRRTRSGLGRRYERQSGPFYLSSAWPVATFGGALPRRWRSDLCPQTRVRISQANRRASSWWPICRNPRRGRWTLGLCVVGLPRQVSIEVLALCATRHEHRRLGRQVHSRLDPGTAPVLAHPLTRVSVAVLAPRLTRDRLDGR